MKKRFCFVFFLVLIFTCAVYCEDVSPADYTKDEFPQWALDVRRTEIITLGSLPFVTLATTLGYSFYRYYDHDFEGAYAPNPFAKTSDSANLDTDEQKLVIGSAALISLGIGLTDLCYNLMKRRSDLKKQNEVSVSGAIKITSSDDESNLRLEDGRERRSAYMYGGMKSAIF